MNLTDPEILELNQLCNALVDGSITESQKTRLAQMLSSSVEARQFYIRAMGLSASLYHYAGEMQLEAPDAVVPQANILHVAFRWGLGSLAAAATIMFVFWISNHPVSPTVTAEVKVAESVAQLTASKECKWVRTDVPLEPGNQLLKGQRLELVSGLAEITFDSGARVVLEGPALLELNSAWDATLIKGTLKANVPPEAIGFLISNQAVEVTDLGTEFTMIADANGTTDVLVLKGSVEAEPQGDVDREKILLLEKESRRFANTGVSKVSDSEEKFARYNQAFSLDRFAPQTGYVHWSFDESEGRQFKADVSGLPATGFEARLEALSDQTVISTHSEGQRNKGVAFDGHLFAKAAFPSISGDGPRTIAFWVKVQEDARLSDSYAMVAWRATNKKLGYRPVHISWNRNPTEGVVGVLRTDYGRGYALGATPLRDGRWHHVAVVFVPGEDPNTPVQVKQYVDGKLEGEGTPSPPGGQKQTVEAASDIDDTIWLGCRLGSGGPRKERFRGEMDELFIADRALGPFEIVSLMKDNQPPQPQLAALKE
jgi:ferric-dicitrate binding protein FerR (iron transport regulator)